MRTPIYIFGRTGNTNTKAQTRTQFIDVTQFLRRDGSTSATSDLDMGGNLIKNLPIPENQYDVANKIYVDTKMNHLNNELRQYIDRIITERVNEAVMDMIDNLGNSTINPLFDTI